MWEAVGITVSRLMRVRYGPILLGNRVRTGKSRELDREEIRLLQQIAGAEVSEPLGLKSSPRAKSPASQQRKIHHRSGGQRGKRR